MWHTNNLTPSTCSVGQAAGFSLTSYLDTIQSELAKSKPIRETSYSPDSETESCQASRYGTTSALSTESLGEDSLTLCAVDFPVRTLVPQGKALALMASEAVYGERWHASFAKYDQDTHLWKTPQYSLLGDLEEFSETWPKWGMMQSGVCSERVTPEHHTGEIASGFLPNGETFFHTPTSGGMDGGSNSRKALKKRQENWPTPRAGKTSDENEESWMKRHKEGKVATPPLTLAVKMNRYGGTPNLQKVPTPLTRDWKDTINGKAPPSRQKTSEQTLGQCVSARSGGKSTPQTYITPRVGGEESMESVAKRKGQAAAERHNTLASVEANHGKKSGQLNPSWVEWLMGWPIGWTDLKPLETGKFRNVQLWHSQILSN